MSGRAIEEFDSTRERSSIVELRQYTILPGKRDVLIDIFEREFVKAQEERGIDMIGQFRDLDNPDRFVWLRGFPDMTNRPRMLESFYSSPEWKANRGTINRNLVDYDNVLLLRDAWKGSGFQVTDRAQLTRSRVALVTVDIHHLPPGAADEFTVFFKTRLEPFLKKAGATSLAALVTETAANNYPRLPVREGERVLVSFHALESLASYDHYLESLDRATAWHASREKTGRRHATVPQTLRLVPTSRSKLG